DALVLSRNVSIYNTDQTMMERTNNVIWRPMPYIAVSYNGTDMTGNFDDYTQLTVPSTIGYQKSVPWIMSATELRDALQEGRLGDAAKQKLASDINVAVLTVAGQQGTLAIKRSAATGFDDVAIVEAVMNETGVPMDSRYLALSTRDYNGMASDLAKNTRSFGNDISDSALRRAFVGQVASFETYKLDYAQRKAAAAGAGIQINTTAAGGNYYTPKATSTSATGETSNVDNRFQTVTVNSTTSIAVGDSFTIANVNAVHMITKEDTGQPKTFRVIAVPSATTLVISPPLIPAQAGVDSTAQYQNCRITSTSATAAITFLNTTASYLNCFWHKDAIELLPGRYAVPTDAGAAVMRASTDQGIELVMTKQYDINNMKTKYRLDCLFGVVCKQPEMAGVLMFN
ncbi:MAG: P22 phage major capsid protein family protein, partial [Phycisphaerales bacterium]